MNPHNTSLVNQRTIVLSALRDAAQTTVSLRHEFGVMHPAARVQELREMGYRIDTVRVATITPDLIKHRLVAKYILLSENESLVEVLQ